MINFSGLVAVSPDVISTVMRYSIIVGAGENSFGVCVPDLPDCGAAGETRQEVIELIHEAIEFHLEGLREDGAVIPKPASNSEYIEVLAA